nr:MULTISPECIES: signal peptidase I [unclassified Streptomyces]
MIAGALLLVGDVVAFGTNIELLSQPRDSMRPTFTGESTVFVESVDGSEVRRGDVVVVSVPEWGGPRRPLLRRVIGIGGDRVSCAREGKLLLNGKPLDEPYVLNGVANGLSEFDVTVPPGRLFLLGDNRLNSVDSRLFPAMEEGTAPLSAVSGRTTTASSALKPYAVPFGGGLLIALAGLVGLVGALITWARSRRT